MISLKFHRDLTLMYQKLLRSTGQRSRSQSDQRISIKKRYNSDTGKLSKVKRGESYHRAERSM